MHRARYLFGFLTLLAAIAGGFWIVRLLQQLDDRPGVLVRVEFHDARGLRAGAEVRYRGVRAGIVREVGLTDGGDRAVVRALLEPAAAQHACVNSTFWIVVPRFAGLSAGATGLDTLVRDPYLAFDTPGERGSPLAPDSLLAGSERPPRFAARSELDEVEHGDLVMQLLLPENHGLRVGSAVTFRGMRTGEVRSVELAPEGSYVTATLRIFRRYRQTVTDQAQFWIARPQLSGALFTGFRIEDVSALLAPFVGYYSRPGEGLPVEDGYRSVALAERPELEVAAVPSAALSQPAAGPVAAADEIVIVRVVYQATEKDTFSPDDPVRSEGSGVLFLDHDGRPVVITARSIVDGGYITTDLFGTAADITGEAIKVMLPSGTVLRAGRVWIQPEGADLAALVLTEDPADLAATPAAKLDFEAASAPAFTLRSAGPDGAALPDESPGEGTMPELPGHRGAAVIADGRVFGIYGRSLPDVNVPVVVPLSLVPADLRP